MLIVFVIYLFSTIPLNQVNILRVSRMELKAWKVSLEGRLEEIMKLEARQKEDEELLESYIISGRIKAYSEGEVHNLVAEVTNLISETNNHITDMKWSLSLEKFSEARTSSGITHNLRKFPVNLIVRGKYSTLKDFFGRLSTFQRLLTVDKVKIELVNPPQLEMELILVFYMFARQQTEGGTE